jgi:hypothetical protein
VSNDSFTDRARKPADAQFRRIGLGDLGATFQCGRCNTYRSILGRRMVKHKGLKRWECRGCVQLAPTSAAGHAS